MDRLDRREIGDQLAPVKADYRPRRRRYGSFHLRPMREAMARCGLLLLPEVPPTLGLFSCDLVDYRPLRLYPRRSRRRCLVCWMALMTPIYLDYNATTPIDPAVLEAMLPWLRDGFGNPSSTHEYGRRAHDAVEKGRAQLAALIGAKPGEVIFTGGGTEASNHAIKGAFFARQRGLPGLFTRLFSGAGHFVTTTIEHPATMKP